MNPSNNTPQGEAAFNAAIAALMRLDSILIDIKNILQKQDIPKPIRQHRKIELVRAFYVQSMPLIKDEEDKKRIKEEVSKLHYLYDFDPTDYYKQAKIPIYSFQQDVQMDDIIIMIEEALQKSGYFMPERKEKIL